MITVFKGERMKTPIDLLIEMTDNEIANLDLFNRPEDIKYEIDKMDKRINELIDERLELVNRYEKRLEYNKVLYEAQKLVKSLKEDNGINR